MASDPLTQDCPRCGGSGRVPDPAKIGARVREARIALGLSLREAGNLAGCSHVHIMDMERGHREWNGPAARRVLAILGLTPAPATEEHPNGE